MMTDQNPVGIPADQKPSRRKASVRESAEDLVAIVEAGAREPKNPIASWLITFLCLGWSGFQLYLAYAPMNSHIARSWHLGFAICLAFLCYPAYKQYSPPMWVTWTQKVIPSFARRSIRTHIPIYDYVLAALATAGALYIWWDYSGIITRMGLPSQTDIIMGVILVVLLLEAARRALGPALAILATIFLFYTVVGPHLPEILRHRGVPLDFIISDMYLTTTGIFGVPLGVSTDFVFLFVLFGALLDRAGGGKYFIDVAFSALGTFRGGPAKAAVMASGLTGMVSGSSIANTVTTGTFTIPLMKKVGFPAHKAAAVEVASSVNGQLMPPIMGAAAFIMAEIIGIPYLDVVRAALFPALISYLALLYIVHIEAMKIGIKAIPRSELPKFTKTVLRGCHFLIPLSVLIFYLVVMRRSPVTAAFLAIQSLVVLMLIQRPIIAFLSLGAHRRAGTLNPDIDLKSFLATAAWQGVQDVWSGLIMGARNMISVGVATATAGIIVGVVTITGLVGRFITIIATLSMGNIVLMLFFTALTSLILGMGMPTTANYIIMATLTAPVIIQLGGDAGLIFPLIAAHLFVFYFGILADVTPPVGLAAYAGAAIARTDPIKTGVQGFAYSMRTAILPFIFLFNTDLLMIAGVTAAGAIIWLDDPVQLAWIFFSGLIAMFAFASALQGWLVTSCNWFERILLLAVCATTFRPGFFEAYFPFERLGMQIMGVSIYFALFAWQMVRTRRPVANP
ncbi:TRAP transporter, 4TM/12TM fusion protein [Desulfonatronum thiosulfatophilum]|uniref:TRAP transporter, 4TM/12TM fusion protein n=1 Tax=Desulfonatronum thiosulfatophilum TaxID=617002 RepID=A0A1G6A239_9BACT|nr:TRAP transporter permease [Desulfonatronum thiosulfatophilum]SDB02477.1 TRAP transporter, 4TM/12TM fusion protein [Desulfonatronum thiosulfatophilum]